MPIRQDKGHHPEKLEGEAYGFACRQALLECARETFPTSKATRFFQGDDEIAMNNLAAAVAKRFPIRYLGKTPDDFPDLLDQCCQAANGGKTNCRLSVLLMGTILERDRLVDEVFAANVAFSPLSVQHAQLYALRNGIWYVGHFAPVKMARVSPYTNDRFYKILHPLTDKGIYSFEKEIGNI